MVGERKSYFNLAEKGAANGQGYRYRGFRYLFGLVPREIEMKNRAQLSFFKLFVDIY